MSVSQWCRRLPFTYAWAAAGVTFVTMIGAAGTCAATSVAIVPPSPELNVVRAVTGRVTNYDEGRVGAYTLPDPLTMNDGTKVRDASAWEERRRPEILELYRSRIYGRAPGPLPAAHFRLESAAPALGGAARRSVVLLTYGERPDGPRTHLVVYTAAAAHRPTPVILHLTFNGDPPRPPKPGHTATPELGPIATLLERGYAYADLRYTEAQADDRGTFADGIAALVAPADSRRAPDTWGAISIWAWVASRALDALSAVPSVDPSRAALVGHSRLGKTALWAGALDPRFGVVFSSCAGEMGSSLARRDFGETIDNIAPSFPWQFAPAFQRYVGHWNDLPVDSHFLIALCAPRPVFITGGTGDLWADPKGEFLAEVAAAPVYRLLGRTGPATDRMPAPDEATTAGDLAFRYHAGGHAILPGDWSTFLDFADRYLRPQR